MWYELFLLTAGAAIMAFYYLVDKNPIIEAYDRYKVGKATANHSLSRASMTPNFTQEETMSDLWVKKVIELESCIAVLDGKKKELSFSEFMGDDLTTKYFMSGQSDPNIIDKLRSIDLDNHISFVFKNKELKVKKNFHGACLSCVTPQKHGIGTCLGCKFMVCGGSDLRLLTKSTDPR
jgi:hypothetical protein